MADDQGLSALLPCPFCGGQAQKRETDTGWRVECGNDVSCNVEATVWLPEEGQAITAWNTRPEGLPALVGEGVVRSLITWLHRRADSMNDPHARAVLNSAAHDLSTPPDRALLAASPVQGGGNGGAAADANGQALMDIAAERRRQMQIEGWTPAHDDEHVDRSLALAAACYAMFASVSDGARDATSLPASMTTTGKPIHGWAAWLEIWPWDRKWWKPKDRPSHPDWFRGVRDQCAAAGVAYHHKQNGEFAHSEDVPAPTPGPRFFDSEGNPAGDGWHFWKDGDRGANASIKVGKKAAGRLLDGVTHDARPKVRA